DASLHDDVTTSDRRCRERPGVSVHDDDAGHHVLAGGPADPTRDVDLRTVDEAASEVAETALEPDPAPGEDPDSERVLRPRVVDLDLLDALLVEEPAELEVDRPRRQISRVEASAMAVDLGDAWRLGERLREATRVIRDLALAYCRHTS